MAFSENRGDRPFKIYRSRREGHHEDVGIGDTLGRPDHAFTTGGDAGFVRVTDATAPLGESMKSGEITDNQVSTLETKVTGPGTVSFQWMSYAGTATGDAAEID